MEEGEHFGRICWIMLMELWKELRVNIGLEMFSKVSVLGWRLAVWSEEICLYKILKVFGEWFAQ